MASLPAFTEDGLLPPGDYVLTIDELLQSPLVKGSGVELYPHIGQGSGIVDQFGYELEFPSAFRQSRDFKPKGIVRIAGVK